VVIPFAANAAVVAPLAALGGALIVALLNIRQQRSQHLRGKMLDAADTFQISMQAADDALLRLARDSESHEEMLAWLERAQAATEDAGRALARLTLLYGPDSRTTSRAMEAHLRLDTTLRWEVPYLAETLRIRDEEPDAFEEDEVDGLRDNVHHYRGLAEDHLREFERSAFTAMRAPGRMRALDRLREPFRRYLWRLTGKTRRLRKKAATTSEQDRAAK
jgi:hypothetical protein